MQVITLQNERLQMNDHIEAAGQELQSKDYDEYLGHRAVFADHD